MPDLNEPGTVLNSLKTAARRLRRWPSASLDLISARRRHVSCVMGQDEKPLIRPNEKRFSLAKRPAIKERGNDTRPNRETSLRSRLFAEIDGHNSETG